MTLDEAIKHADEMVEFNMEGAAAVLRCHGIGAPGYYKHCQCAEENRQLASWLRELKEYKEKDNGK